MPHTIHGYNPVHKQWSLLSYKGQTMQAKLAAVSRCLSVENEDSRRTAGGCVQSCECVPSLNGEDVDKFGEKRRDTVNNKK